MADRSRHIARLIQFSSSTARVGGREEEEEIQRANNGVANKRPRVSGSTSESRAVQPPQLYGRVCSSRMAEDVILLEQEDSDSCSGSEDVYESQEDDGDDDDVEEEAPTNFAPPSSQLKQATSGSGSRSCSAVAAAVDNEAISVVLTDPNVLDCPICITPLHSPIYQCENGHIVCSSCYIKWNRKCSSCFLPIGSSRCRAMEKLLESVRLECKNKMFGCEESLIYHKKSEHEKLCLYEPCLCPHSSCDYSDSSKNLYHHFSSCHKSHNAYSFTFDTNFRISFDNDQKYMILQERDEGVIFILNHGIQENGNLFNIDCIGPDAFNGAYTYKLSVKYEETLLSIETVPVVRHKWRKHIPCKNYITVPSEYMRKTGVLILQVCIKKAHPVL